MEPTDRFEFVSSTDNDVTQKRHGYACTVIHGAPRLSVQRDGCGKHYILKLRALPPERCSAERPRLNASVAVAADIAALSAGFAAPVLAFSLRAACRARHEFECAWPCGLSVQILQ